MGRKHNYFVTADERRPHEQAKFTRPGSPTIVLINPRIPQNTGSIARMCAATGSRLDIVNPFFEITDAKLKRAGLDYWPMLDVRIFKTFADWRESEPDARPWLVEVVGSKVYTEAAFAPNDFIFFGDEQDGISGEIISLWPDRTLRIPQVNVRSMNLSMCAGVVCFEALRQLDWLSLEER